MISRFKRLPVVFAFVLAALCPAAASAQTADADAARLELAERLMNLSQGLNVIKQVEQQLRQIAEETPDLTQEQRDWMAANMPRMGRSMLAALIEDLAAIYAENFTTAELQAQIDFHETPIGQSILEKSVAIGFEQAEVVGVHQEAFVTELMTKFCLRFDCASVASVRKPD